MEMSWAKTQHWGNTSVNNTQYLSTSFLKRIVLISKTGHVTEHKASRGVSILNRNISKQN